MSEQPIQIRVVIVYYTRFGVLKLLADEIAAGVAQVPGAVVDRIEIDDHPVEQPRAGEPPDAGLIRRAAMLDRLALADAIIVGSPAYFGCMAAAVKHFFEECTTASSPVGVDRTRPWRAPLFRDKVGAAFTASATPHGGNENALHSILTMMMHLGMILVTPGQGDPILENLAAPYGPTVIAGADGVGVPTEAEREAARACGRRVAERALWLRLGYQGWLRQFGPGEASQSARLNVPGQQPESAIGRENIEPEKRLDG